MTTIQQPVIATERLLLKEISPEIMQQLITTCTDSEMMDALGLSTKEQLATEKSNHAVGMTTYRMSYKRFVMVEKATGKAIGKCGFHNWYAMHSRAELGYAMDDESAKRKGYMAEAVRAVIQHGFDAMGLNRIEAYVSRHNVPSLKIIQGNGFIQEGVLRQHYCKDRVTEDSLCFGLLLADYRAIQAAAE